jgi:hypothetical protein
MKFSDLVFEPHELAGQMSSLSIAKDFPYPDVQARATFPNGYSASVIRTCFSYGGDQGLYELAVLHGGQLVYDTPVTSDVEGSLTEADVERLLAQVEALPPRAN